MLTTTPIVFCSLDVALLVVAGVVGGFTIVVVTFEESARMGVVVDGDATSVAKHRAVRQA